MHNIQNLDVLVGNCVDTLKTLPDQHINTVVTSPPYFGLRDYGQAKQIGLEATPDEFVEALVEVFREVRRVLRDDGTVWLNLGDSYHAHKRKVTDNAEAKQETKRGSTGAPSRHVPGLKPKDLIGIPWRVAFALQADGWYLRQDIIWHKPNPMPESVRDRCTKAHEYVFLLSKSPKYYYDFESIKEPAKWERWGNQTENKKHIGTAGHLGGKTLAELPIKDTKNKRSVWTIPTKPYRGAHFAAFPPDLVAPCILAGSPIGGTVLDPFGGSGTTAGVALSHDRRAVLCELNPEYVDLIPARIDYIRNYYSVKNTGGKSVKPSTNVFDQIFDLPPVIEDEDVDEGMDRIMAANQEHVGSEESSKKRGDVSRGKTKPKTECIYCGRMIANNMLHRYHMENCKEKPNDK